MLRVNEYSSPGLKIKPLLYLNFNNFQYIILKNRFSGFKNALPRMGGLIETSKKLKKRRKK
jgi:hypothetical protein